MYSFKQVFSPEKTLGFFSDIFVPDEKFGFLSKDNLKELPVYSVLHGELNIIIKNLPELLNKKQLRLKIDALNKKYSHSKKIVLLSNTHEKNIAILMLTMLAQAYIWESLEKPANIIPDIIACNLEILSRSMQRYPIMSYRDYVLNNWYCIGPKNGITLDNIEPIFTLTGDISEKWFIKIHVVIEALSAPAIHALYEASLLNYMMNPHDSLKYKSDEKYLIELLTHGVAASINKATKVLLKMKDHCVPEFFYQRLRPLLNGWDDKLGIMFEKEQNMSHNYKGSSGAQSSVLPALDAGLGVKHEMNSMFQHLLTFQQYMPLEHQHFINQLKIRAIISKPYHSNEVTEALHCAVQEVQRFRFMHYHVIIHNFIAKPGVNKGVSSDMMTGTGGTDIDDYLLKRHSNTQLPRAKL